MLFWWPLYRINDQVFVQNHILFFDQLDVPFDPTNPYESVRPRTTIEDGQEVSEWRVTIEDLQSFVHKNGSFPR